MRTIRVALALALLALPLLSCGRKGQPEPPPDQIQTYPRIYPYTPPQQQQQPPAGSNQGPGQGPGQ